VEEIRHGRVGRRVDVDTDGRRFIVSTISEDRDAALVTVVRN